ncbi:MAG: bifunctional diaminohydroxyphosphoribosylaminopyrimidine deaminase/5-amino-6-(5-phosphoribosylamino)uracil reductase RibD [Gemmatimonadetes bacterium]|nr:bifunctional diaminohydroxyphosphoribosylaminopyrimidine deaminase/5-amino-6-(5-phosphoribosylamino)uracil reductase RibD [Gemmatimonadota bacterium]MBI3568392.1 bifunctional diaminohydroxyphosphoribosylaminopyrimidine deaminase/5-amino-6-(5-phosphoribosylamino)uracil reductase RibD [Gemmatimonadota bacterium]
MRRALALARRGWGLTAPNPMVGAVVVLDGVIVGEGYHARYGDPHAEVMALAAAGERARGATVLVSLEPCNHHGKTPPCVDALIAAGVSRVVAAVADPNPVAKGGADRLRAAGITVDFGCEAAAALELNAAFFHAAAGARRPWVTLKLAVSVDNAIATASREPRWLTGDAARHYVHRLRATNDAIGVGVGTALTDDPQLTVRHGRRPRVPPTRVVFDRTARLPESSVLARTARRTPTIVLAEAPDPERVAALERRGVVILVQQGLEAALEALAARGIRSLFVEGGAELSKALLAAGLVDRLIIFQAPVLLGPGALPAFAGAPPAERFRVVERREFGDDLMTVYALRELPSPAPGT